MAKVEKGSIQFTSSDQTAPLCPLYVPMRSPESEYHTQGNRALLHVNNKSPSRLYLMCVMERS